MMHYARNAPEPCAVSRGMERSNPWTWPWGKTPPASQTAHGQEEGYALAMPHHGHGKALPTEAQAVLTVQSLELWEEGAHRQDPDGARPAAHEAMKPFDGSLSTMRAPQSML